MSFSNEDLVTYRAINNSAALNNGGRMSENISISSSRGNIFPDISDTERATGSTLWRKLFWINKNDNNLSFRTPSAIMTQYTPGNDWVMMCLGTQSDTQIDIQNTTRFYGAAKLKNTVSTGASTFTVTLEDASMGIFATNDSIRISNALISEVHHNVSITRNGVDVDITLAEADSVVNIYNSNETTVSSILPTGDLVTSYDTLNVISSSGILDYSNHDIELFNAGTLYQNWTIKFYSPTQFTLSGDTLGFIMLGSTSEDFIPLNGTVPYCILYKEIWQGSWNINDEVKFRTLPAAIALWFKRVVPSGSSTTYNNFKHIIRGQATTQ